MNLSSDKNPAIIRAEYDWIYPRLNMPTLSTQRNLKLLGDVHVVSDFRPHDSQHKAPEQSHFCSEERVGDLEPERSDLYEVGLIFPREFISRANLQYNPYLCPHLLLPTIF